ncbi:hypothetical protein [Paenibacillus qinlingensis]|uniref:Uncharacterized protein n=1 Tax=Paenibacillus qinlingensis TaxID=1837343 RepID=A0ABU1P3N8_9BACL|nr:hypothetical protein [Paenibacillus qinlingensis]MDR6553971.1 hypothetical protein [Paenibacillus qinlingensis]
MKKALEGKKLKLRSLTFVHDPDAAQKWFALYVEILTDRIIDKSAILKADEHINDLNSFIEGEPV